MSVFRVLLLLLALLSPLCFFAAPPALAGPGTLVIAIDAGHGGKDPGAIGAGGLQEKTVTLAVARELKAQLDKIPAVRGELTRDGDYFLSLAERVEKARAAKAVLLISLHADAAPADSARGSSVFVLSEHGASSAAARWLAKRENAADLLGGIRLDTDDPYLRQTLLDLSQTGTLKESTGLAEKVLSALAGLGPLHTGMVEQAAFAVLKAPDIPSILVEMAFISHKEEAALLRSASYQKKLARSLAEGVREHVAAQGASLTRLARR